jgi:hypothetical protein
MGKALVWLGNKISFLWCNFQCFWNFLLLKISFNVESCPNKLCTCKK